MKPKVELDLKIKTMFITSKTHRFIKIRTTASDYYVKKFLNGDNKANRKIHDSYMLYFNFYKELIKFSIGKGYDEYFEMEYMLGAMDSSKEELHEKTGIKICDVDDFKIYCIPKTKENNKIYNYIIENIPCEFKILKRTRGTYCDHGPQNYYRKIYKRNYNDFIKEHSK